MTMTFAPRAVLMQGVVLLHQRPVNMGPAEGGEQQQEQQE